MSAYIFFYRKMDVGGCQLLIEKLGEKLADNNDVYCCCEQVSEIMNERLVKAGISIQVLPDWNDNHSIKEWISCFSGDIRIISFIWVDYSRLHYIVGKRAKIVFYAIHYDAVKIAAWHTNRIVRSFREIALKNTIKRLIENNSIIFMDEQTIDKTSEYYKHFQEKTLKRCRILRIPVREKVVCAAEIGRIVNNKKTIILW